MHLDALDAQIQSWAAHLSPAGEALLRLFLAAVAGGLVGLEREVRGREAGFRTNLLVCLGSALTMIVSLQFATHRWIPQNSTGGININIDPARIAYGVMTGVGFLGAGAIVRFGGSVRGLTTAAAMWCVAAIGLAMGFGMYVVGALAAIITVSALWLLDYFEDWIPKTRYRTVTVRHKWESDCILNTVDYFKNANLDVVDVAFQRSDDLLFADISVKVAFTNRKEYYTFERRLVGDGQYILISAREL